MAEKTTVTIVAIFCAYVAYTTYNMYGFFVPPAAKAGESCISNLFSDSPQPLDLRLYVSTDQKMLYTRALRKSADWEELNFIYNSTYMTQAIKNLTVSIPAPVQRGKRPLYAHLFVSSAGANSKSSRLDWHLQTRTTLVRSLPIPPPSTKRRLLGEPAASNESDASPATASPGDERFHWIPHIRLHMVWDFTCFSYRTIPADVHRAYQFVERDSRYIPPLAVDEFHVRNDVIAPLIVNDTTVELPLEISFGPLSIGWWRLYSNLQNSLDVMQQSMGAEEKDTDDIRRMITETSPWLLLVTLIVSMLHLLFDTLAFKNDVSFWKNRKTSEGISARGVALSAICQGIALLYLIENDSSKLVLFSTVAGLAIELWKLVRIAAMRGTATDAMDVSEASETEKADEEVGKYMMRLMSPAVVAYSLYSLLYEDHHSWYGWIISSLYGLVFTLGFAAMTPQLFINYRLKTVEHMNWRTLGYKACNTFVDDLFAFIITMPLMHRLSTLRDDVVFFIFLYQLYLYPMDKTRCIDGSATPDTISDKKEK